MTTISFLRSLASFSLHIPNDRETVIEFLSGASDEIKSPTGAGGFERLVPRMVSRLVGIFGRLRMGVFEDAV